jgi:hypothetical protein
MIIKTETAHTGRLIIRATAISPTVPFKASHERK